MAASAIAIARRCGGRTAALGPRTAEVGMAAGLWSRKRLTTRVLGVVKNRSQLTKKLEEVFDGGACGVAKQLNNVAEKKKEEDADKVGHGQEAWGSTTHAKPMEEQRAAIADR